MSEKQVVAMFFSQKSTGIAGYFEYFLRKKHCKCAAYRSLECLNIKHFEYSSQLSKNSKASRWRLAS
jgi:hypothetical protein